MVTQRDSHNQMQSYSTDKSNSTSEQTEVSSIDTEGKKDKSNFGNGLVLAHDDVDGSGGNKRTNKVVDSDLTGAEFAFENPKVTNLNSDLLSELKLSVQTLESSNQSFECQAKCEATLDTEYNKRRNRLIVRAVVLLCLAGALQGILVNGLINVVISSIEKRYPCCILF